MAGKRERSDKIFFQKSYKKQESTQERGSNDTDEQA